MLKRTGLDYIVYVNTGVGKRQPESLFEIIGDLDLSKMIKHNHLKISINGEEYWIPFIKGNKVK